MKTMNKRIMTLVAGLAWAGAALAATHEGVQLWENGPLWPKTNVGANPLRGARLCRRIRHVDIISHPGFSPQAESACTIRLPGVQNDAG